MILYERPFPPLNKKNNKKGNCDFFSHNSEIFSQNCMIETLNCVMLIIFSQNGNSDFITRNCESELKDINSYNYIP